MTRVQYILAFAYGVCGRSDNLFKINVGISMAKVKKITTHLACEGCKSRNYTQLVNKNRKAGSLSLKKFCFYKSCRKHTMHKETK